jgi:predicted phosphoribosyltransferase
VTEAEILRAAAVEMREIERRIARYRAGRPAPDVRGRTAILVDDGLATGGTARAALRALRRAAPSRLVLAVPVAPRGTAEALATEADAVAILATPEPFEAVGRWYDDFAQTPDEEVIALLRSRERELGSPA